MKTNGRYIVCIILIQSLFFTALPVHAGWGKARKYFFGKEVSEAQKLPNPDEVAAQAIENRNNGIKAGANTENGVAAIRALHPDSKTPVLDHIGTNLTKKAKNGDFDHIKVNNKLIREVLITMLSPTTSNAMITAHAGAGKSASIEGLAKFLLGASEADKEFLLKKVQKEYGKAVSEIHSLEKLGTHRELADAELERMEILKVIANDYSSELAKGWENWEVVSVDVNNLMAGTRFRGDFEERLAAVVKEAKENNKILVFDEAHTLLAGAGKTEGSSGADQLLKAEMTRGELKAIFMTTTDEFHEYLTNDSALMRRLRRIKLPSMTEAEAIEVIRRVAEVVWETKFGIKVSAEAAAAIVRMAVKTIHDIKLPASALELGERIAGRKSFLGKVWTDEMVELKEKYELKLNEFKRLKTQKETLELEGKPSEGLSAQLAKVGAEARNLYEKLKPMIATFEAQKSITEVIVGKQAKLVSAKKDLSHLLKTDTAKLLGDDLVDYENKLFEAKKLFAETEVELKALYKERGEKVKEAAFYSEITADDVRKEALVRAGFTPEKAGLTDKELAALLKTSVKEAVGENANAANKLIEPEQAKIYGFTNGNRPNSYLVAGKAERAEEIINSMSESILGKKAYVIDMGKVGDDVSEVFGQRSSGPFTKEILESPFQYVLIKNFEDLKNIDLQKQIETMLEEGVVRVHDGKSVKTLNFSHTTVIIHTRTFSNVDDEEIQAVTKISEMEQVNAAAELFSKKLGTEDANPFSNSGAIVKKLARTLKNVQNFVNLGEMSIDDMTELAQAQLKGLSKTMADFKNTLNIDDKALNLIALLARELGGDTQAFQTVIKHRIERQITRLKVGSKIPEGAEVNVTAALSLKDSAKLTAEQIKKQQFLVYVSK